MQDEKDGVTAAPAAEEAEAPELTEGDVRDGAPSAEENAAPRTEDGVNYEELMERDMAELRREFPELSSTRSLTEIKNPLRYAALRDMGLTPTEAYLAARGKAPADTRSHLVGGVPRQAGNAGGAMPRSELEGARELFYGMSDSEIQRLWRRVTK
ncbi:MAG: hypothetical protein IJW48_02005 [Clostridia bacterium]|nr:hypothetical protein [Clostridia bacterium]